MSVDGHWSRFHRFFSHAAWDIDDFSMCLAKSVVMALAPGATFFWAVDDTLCRKRGLTLYGAGMHYDPLISSRAKPLVSWGHDWVVLTLIVAFPVWAPSKVFALPIAMRLYRNRQGLTKGKKGPRARRAAKKSTKPKHDPNHRTRPELALELIKSGGPVVPRRRDHRLRRQRLRRPEHPLPPAAQRPPHQPCPSQGGTLRAGSLPRRSKSKGRARKKGDRLPGMKQWAEDPNQPWTELKFDQFGLHATLAVKTMQALYYKAGKDRLLTIVLTHDVEGKRPDQMFYCTKLDWTARQILSAYACRWAIECTFENCKQFLGLEDPANRLPKAVARTAPMALFLYTLVVVWFHQTGHRLLRFPFRPWYTKKEEPSFADMLTTLRRVSYEEKTEQLLPEQCPLKTWIAQLTELLSRTG